MNGEGLDVCGASLLMLLLLLQLIDDDDDKCSCCLLFVECLRDGRGCCFGVDKLVVSAAAQWELLLSLLFLLLLLLFSIGRKRILFN